MLQIKNLHKEFPKEEGTMVAIDDFTYDVKEGEFVCILGPSGCGKTTVLRIVAGLEERTSGSLMLDGKEVNGPGSDRGMVFQEFALLPWRNVRKNVEFGLEIKGLDVAERKVRSDKYIELVGLKGFESYLPKQLSGGMKQRVGIARALANDPEILLMDEPFGALDAQTRNQMQKELLRIWEETRKTVLFVTHSVDEAVFLADRVVVLTSRPSRIKEVFEVKQPRPRDRADPAFLALRKRILAELEQETIQSQQRPA
ncbi:MAG: putative ABC transporter ATP-binding protein [Methanomassiliicoccales archaeon PtaU1.Bin124]|nr:MAG: putative ABC transporter ATP-binding protein [Methanomassiliicoccales archaeon PtaU1.Bin124]